MAHNENDLSDVGELPPPLWDDDDHLPLLDAGELITCSWFAKCVRPAAGRTPHPILGEVPICQECAERHGLEVVS